MGAHVIKVGLSPLLIDWMRRGVLDALATNGAGAVHDSEVARFGVTSEDVGAGIKSGLFGMARETGEFINSAASGRRQRCRIRRNAGRAAVGRGEKRSGTACRLQLAGERGKIRCAVSIHVAIGSDIPHPQPSMDGAATGAATYNDFKIFAHAVKDLSGGVLINIGSSVLLPTIIESRSRYVAISAMMCATSRA
jgi:hypothetical protein